MKIGGVVVSGPNVEILVLPRPTNNIVIKAQTVADFKEFERMVPYPTAPGVRTKDGFKKDTKAPAYRDEVSRYESLRFAWMVITSLAPSEIEWETVNLDQPQTWLKWEEEFKKAGLSEVEINKITLTVMQANSLDESKLQAAREAFLLGQQVVASDISGQDTEPESI
ncbi:MAG: hypothetical protein E6Q97_38170 [Desulfurellales bacterium]|nr:MAG: hypothetical protein E6Q97_38170 [Desulfurellales bacterium]